MDTINNNNNRRPNEQDNQNARLGLVDKIVDRARKPMTAAANAAPSLSKRYTLDEVLDQVLRANSDSTGPNGIDSNSGIGIGLRSLDQADLETLLRGFEPEEAAEGKFVLYITEKQLMQLLKQRAVIVPNLTNGAPEPLVNLNTTTTTTTTNQRPTKISVRVTLIC